MTRFTRLPTQALAIALFAVTGLAAAHPMADLVDCSDSFWIIACTEGEDPEPRPDVILGEPVQIDNDPVCVEFDGGYMICHT